MIINKTVGVTSTYPTSQLAMTPWPTAKGSLNLPNKSTGYDPLANYHDQ